MFKWEQLWNRHTCKLKLLVGNITDIAYVTKVWDACTQNTFITDGDQGGYAFTPVYLIVTCLFDNKQDYTKNLTDYPKTW